MGEQQAQLATSPTGKREPFRASPTVGDLYCHAAKVYFKKNKLSRLDKKQPKHKKKARKKTPSQNKAERKHSVYAEPCGLCATTSQKGTSDKNNAVMKMWQSSGDNA